MRPQPDRVIEALIQINDFGRTAALIHNPSSVRCPSGKSPHGGYWRIFHDSIEFLRGPRSQKCTVSCINSGGQGRIEPATLAFQLDETPRRTRSPWSARTPDPAQLGSASTRPARAADIRRMDRRPFGPGCAGPPGQGRTVRVVMHDGERAAISSAVAGWAPRTDHRGRR